MSDEKRRIYPAEMPTTVHLDNVIVRRDQFIWLRLVPGFDLYEGEHLEITYLNGDLIIHCTPEFAGHIKIVPYDENGNAPGMEDIDAVYRMDV